LRFIEYYFSGNILLFLVTYFAFHRVLFFNKYSAVPCYILCFSSSTIVQGIFYCFLLHTFRFIEYYCSGNILLFLLTYFAFHRVLFFRKYFAVPCYILCLSPSTIVQEIACCSLLHTLRFIEYYYSRNSLLFLVTYFAFHRVLLFRKYSAVPCYIFSVSSGKL
jgi:hypothetical protein